MPSQKIRVGIAGQGRSGYSIHAQTVVKLPDLYDLVAVADPLPDRRADALKLVPTCKSYSTTEELLADPNVELAVIATPSYLHTSQTLAALRAGKAVLCEKPFSLTLKDFDVTVAESRRLGLFLAPFQQRRYEPSLAKIQQLIVSNTLGRITHARLCLHTFGRRWDWQTLKQFGGGLLYNNTPHLLDLGLQLFGPDDPATIFCDLQRTLATGDAEDHVKITLKAPHQPTIDIELMATDAFLPHDLWFVQGTNGTLRGSASSLDWKTVNWNDYPPRPADPTPTPGRTYCHEDLTFAEGHWSLPKDHPTNQVRFYQDLYTSLRNNAPLHVTLPSIRRQIAIIDHCRRTCPV
jgi:predicted dehydrogenase